MIRPLFITVTLAVALGACRGEVSSDPPITPLRNMHFQQRYNSQATSRFYSDHRTMRTPPLGTVARFPGGANPSYHAFSIGRDETFDDEALHEGHEPGSTTYVTSIPSSVAQSFGGADAMLAHGRERFDIYCTPCHGELGDGRGPVYLRSQPHALNEPPPYTYPQPANLHDERLRHIPDGQLYATVRNGVRNMPGYAAQIPTNDRWAIVAYVRALQLSQAQGVAQ